MTITENSIVANPPVESSSSAVSWASIFAGAIAASAITLVLLLVGAGLGFSMVSPWQSQSASPVTLGVSAVIWLVVVQWLSAGLGGYLTGRLRTKWVGVHTYEVGFRDTAHGFLAWALSTLIIAGLLTSSVSAILGAGVQATATTAGAAVTAAASQAGNLSPSYFTDALLRPANPATATTANADTATAQISRILANAAVQGKMPDADRSYVDRLVAAQTGLSEADAKARVDAVLKQIDDAKVAAQQAADKARKVSSAAALLGALTLFIGAFIAAVSAAFGGRQRDDDEEALRALK
jgi:hypothetical protein